VKQNARSTLAPGSLAIVGFGGKRSGARNPTIAQKMCSDLLSMTQAGGSGKGHQQAVEFCVHPSRLTHKAGGVDTDNG